ncbi:MAG TPA: serine/threonine-protein kinase, partial [Myxococcota bacterium]
MSAARIDNYELIDRFAVGGVAEIFRARDLKSGDVVVIKRLRPDLAFDPEQHAGFIRELQLALMCKHKNLIRGFHKGTQNGSDYGVLEFIDGKDLQTVLKQVRPLPLGAAAFIVSEALDGLDFAFRLKDNNGHQLGLVHRDLAPKNILVTYDGAVRVGDFGSSLATLTEPRPKEVVGTLGYLSPEQARGESIDQRSDLYAMGLILYELVVGSTAFDVDGKKDAAVLKLHQRGVCKPVPSSVPDDLRLVIEIATAPEPDDRYKSARDMRAGLLRAHAADAGDLAALMRGITR